MAESARDSSVLRRKRGIHCMSGLPMRFVKVGDKRRVAIAQQP